MTLAKAFMLLVTACAVAMFLAMASLARAEEAPAPRVSVRGQIDGEAPGLRAASVVLKDEATGAELFRVTTIGAVLLDTLGQFELVLEAREDDVADQAQFLEAMRRQPVVEVTIGGRAYALQQTAVPHALWAARVAMKVVGPGLTYEDGVLTLDATALPGALVGPKGDKGDAGAVGPAGAVGATGAAGAKGDKGDQGIAGVAGPAGAVGPAGAQGVKGDKGDQGAAGAVGPAGAAGAKGDKGDQGIAGPVGAQGAKGDQGVAGPKGDQGIAGPAGAQGAIGPIGLTGAQGAVGPAGPAGAQGAVGPAGPAGAQGATGPQGPQGPQGLQGPQGVAGSDADHAGTLFHASIQHNSQRGYLNDAEVELTRVYTAGGQCGTYNTATCDASSLEYVVPAGMSLTLTQATETAGACYLGGTVTATTNNGSTSTPGGVVAQVVYAPYEHVDIGSWKLTFAAGERVRLTTTGQCSLVGILTAALPHAGSLWTANVQQNHDDAWLNGAAVPSKRVYTYGGQCGTYNTATCDATSFEYTVPAGKKLVLHDVLASSGDCYIGGRITAETNNGSTSTPPAMIARQTPLNYYPYADGDVGNHSNTRMAFAAGAKFRMTTTGQCSFIGQLVAAP